MHPRYPKILPINEKGEISVNVIKFGIDIEAV